MKSYLTFGIAGVLIVTTGLVHAYWKGAFGKVNESEILKQFADRIEDVPLVIGDWVGADDAKQIDAREREVAGVDAGISRVYTNRLTQQSVTIFLASGYFRNVAQHTPNQCFPAAGYQQLNDEIQYVEPVGEHSVSAYTTVFKLDEASGTRYQRVFWTWSHDGIWQAPDVPRLALAGHPALYKLYFITGQDIPGLPPEESPSVKFMHDFIPVLNKVLFPPAEPGAEGEASPAPLATEADAPAKAED